MERRPLTLTPELIALRDKLAARLEAQQAYAKRYASTTAAPVIDARLQAFREVLDIIDGVA